MRPHVLELRSAPFRAEAMRYGKKSLSPTDCLIARVGGDSPVTSFAWWEAGARVVLGEVDAGVALSDGDPMTGLRLGAQALDVLGRID